MMPGAIVRAALLLVPSDWRDTVARDLLEDPSCGGWRLAWRGAMIGVRLRAARLRDAISHPRAERVTMMRDFTRDLRLAVRSMLRRPAHALAVVATLGIGIGANTAIYSVFNWILFRPLPGAAKPAELVTIQFQTARRIVSFFVSYRGILDVREGVPALSAVAASHALAVDLAMPGAVDSQRIDAEVVTANYFALLGVTPAPGRDFLPAEERPADSAPSTIISYSLWKRLFDASPAAIGRTLLVNGQAFVVAGVAPSGFQGRSLVVATDVWIPLGAHQLVLPNLGPTLQSDRRRTLFIDAFGRLRPGQSIDVAQQQAAALVAARPDFALGRKDGKGNRVGPVVYAGIGQNTFVQERLTALFRLVMGAVGLVLLLACANAANLLLARSLARRREIAVCQAIGAGRLRIVRQQLAEGLVFACAAGIAGLFLARVLTSLFDGMQIVPVLPAVRGISPDGRVILFTTVVSLATGLLFSIAPALASSRADLTAALKDGSTRSRGGRGMLRASLGVVQIAVSILLLISAGLLARTMDNLRAIDLGFQPQEVMSFSANPTRVGYDRVRAHAYLVDAVERLRQTPGVTSAAYSLTTPFLPMRQEWTFDVDGGQQDLTTVTNVVSPGYFATLGIPLLAGRDFADDEWRSSEPHVAIVSALLARKIAPAGSAIGRRLALDYGKGLVVTIVGVVGDVRGRPLSDDPEPHLYVPADGTTFGVIHVRAAGGAGDAAAAIRRVARAIDPALPPYDVEPFTASIDRTLSEQQVLARLSTVFAAVGALLAAIGVYGMMACSVGERMREFGIRLALGARAALLLRLVLAAAARVAAIGLLLGTGAALLLTRGLESRLYGVTRGDPWTIAASCLGLILVSVAASGIPAWRASRADPVSALRVE